MSFKKSSEMKIAHIVDHSKDRILITFSKILKINLQITNTLEPLDTKHPKNPRNTQNRKIPKNQCPFYFLHIIPIPIHQGSKQTVTDTTGYLIRSARSSPSGGSKS